MINDMNICKHNVLYLLNMNIEKNTNMNTPTIHFILFSLNPFLISYKIRFTKILLFISNKLFLYRMYVKYNIYHYKDNKRTDHNPDIISKRCTWSKKHYR